YLGLAVSGDFAFPVYASTAGGDLDIFAHTIRIAAPIFADGFESGDFCAWSSGSTPCHRRKDRQ
ncbi:MAG: hypothetical protein GY953_08410, partial [bacterium]|nr:hypothetical protein [bacterium]